MAAWTARARRRAIRDPRPRDPLAQATFADAQGQCDRRPGLGLSKPAAERTPREVQLVFDALAKDRRVKPEVFDLLLGPDLASIRAACVLAPPRRPEIRARPLAAGAGPSTRSRPRHLRLHLLRRGDFYSQGPEAEPGFPAVLTSGSSSDPCDPAGGT